MTLAVQGPLPKATLHEKHLGHVLAILRDEQLSLVFHRVQPLSVGRVDSWVHADAMLESHCAHAWISSVASDYYLEIEFQGRDCENAGLFSISVVIGICARSAFREDISADDHRIISTAEFLISGRPDASSHGCCTLGCGVSRVDGHIFYTKNGVRVRTSWHNPSELDAVDLLPVVAVRRSGSDHPLVHVRFLGEPFLFDADRASADSREEQRKGSTRTLATFPQEVLLQICTIAAERFQDDKAALSILSTVCSAWYKICCPILFRNVRTGTLAALQRLKKALNPASSSPHFPSELETESGSRYIREGSPGHVVLVPTLAVNLLSLGPNMKMLEKLTWDMNVQDVLGLDYHDDRQISLYQAPPRVELATSAFLRQLGQLTTLNIANVMLPSFAHLLHIIRAPPALTSVELFAISFTREFGGHLPWPSSLVLTKLTSLRILDSNAPTVALPMLASLALRSTPHFAMEDSTSSRTSDETKSLLSIAMLFSQLCALPSDDTEGDTARRWSRLSLIVCGSRHCYRRLEVNTSGLWLRLDVHSTCVPSDAPIIDGVELRFTPDGKWKLEQVLRMLAVLDDALAQWSSYALASRRAFVCRVHVVGPHKLTRAVHGALREVMPRLCAERRVTYMYSMALLDASTIISPEDSYVELP